MLRCGYRHSELSAMSIDEFTWRVEREAAYEKLLAEAAKRQS
ncbi:hypothetical protein [Camelimonas lactis]|nr:hypothetical protein [Camelimonas lactis]